MISIILPVHNKQDMIEQVLQGIITNSSSLVKEVIIILDGCTDKSEELVHNFCKNCASRIEWHILYAPNVFETKACNMGFHFSSEPYCLNIQDDMIITELGYDVRLIKPMLVWKDVFAVTALAAVNLYVSNEHLQWNDAVNFHNTPRNKFVVRDVVNRGPLLLSHAKLEALNYLDEVYAPQGMDDMDICMRAYEVGWVSGVYAMPAFFEPAWGTTRNNPVSADIVSKAWIKNESILLGRHRAAIEGPKHSEDRTLE
jgi:glycosyltransferase involved in cell wall biosynthesis